MAEHTKGPWLLLGDNVIACGENYDDQIGGVFIRDGYQEREANAARIVACVNALEGYNPEAVRDVVDALRQADAALNSMAALVEAEWRDHDKAMTRHDNDVRAFRELRRNALARLGGAS